MTDALDASAVEAVAKLAVEAAGGAAVVTIDRYQFGPERLQRLNLNPETPVPLEFSTLDGFAQYLLAEFGPDSTQESAPLLVHVHGPTQVRAVGPLLGPDKSVRSCYAVVERVGSLRGFSFNQMGKLEGLAIALQTCFAPKVGRIEELRKFCASVRSTNEVGVADDGVSQTVQAKRGIAAVQTVEVANPWELAPFRTFAEIGQPTSTYVLRFEERGGDLLAGLYEVGDGSWEVEAVQRITSHLLSVLGPDWTVAG